MSQPPSNPDLDEWKMCVDQINKLDGYLIDLRKYGFGIITGIGTASSFLGFAEPSRELHIGVIFADIVLVAVLFWIDQFYQTRQYGIVGRGIVLEPGLDRALIEHLTDFTRSNVLTRIFRMALIYIGFAAALMVLGIFTSLNEAQSESPLRFIADEEYFKQISFHEDIVMFLTVEWPLLLAFAATAAYIVAIHYKVEKARETTYRDILGKVEEFKKEIENTVSDLNKTRLKRQSKERYSRGILFTTSEDYFRITEGLDKVVSNEIELEEELRSKQKKLQDDILKMLRSKNEPKQSKPKQQTT